MKEQLVKFETAKLASEKGYGPILLGSNFKDKLPTQSLLQKWLREVHGIEVIPSPYSKRKSYGCEVYHYTEKNETGYVPIELGSFETYEEALEKGLQEALKLIKNKKNEKI